MPADDEQDLTFTAALQSHFAVRYRKFAEVVGLLGKSLLQVWTFSTLSCQLRLKRLCLCHLKTLGTKYQPSAAV